VIVAIVLAVAAIGACPVLTCMTVCVGRSFFVQLNTLSEVDVTIVMQSDNSLDFMTGVQLQEVIDYGCFFIFLYYIILVFCFLLKSHACQVWGTHRAQPLDSPRTART